jgi:hypothetical protein
MRYAPQRQDAQRHMGLPVKPAIGPKHVTRRENNGMMSLSTKCQCQLHWCLIIRLQKPTCISDTLARSSEQPAYRLICPTTPGCHTHTSGYKYHPPPPKQNILACQAALAH